jgi:hypothetical protein
MQTKLAWVLDFADGEVDSLFDGVGDVCVRRRGTGEEQASGRGVGLVAAD